MLVFFKFKVKIKYNIDFFSVYHELLSEKFQMKNQILLIISKIKSHVFSSLFFLDANFFFFFLLLVLLIEKKIVKNKN